MSGARTRRIERLTRIFPELADMRGLEGEMNRSSWTLHNSREASCEVPLPISYSPRGMSESEEVLAVSNYEVAQERLGEAALFDDGVSYRSDLWPGGTIYTLVIRADDAGAVREAVSIIRALSDYPVLDDEDLSQRESDAMWKTWENCFRSDTESIMTGKLDVPEDLFWPQGWGEQGVTVDLDELVTDCPTWQEWSLDESIDLDELAGELAGTIRVKLAGPDADKSWARDCWCCGAPVIGPVWTLCDGCDGHGDGSDCDPDESWHCDHRAGHECDGTVCAEEAEEHERKERLRVEAYGGMDPEHMTPLW